MLSLYVILFSMAPINCSQGEKEVESGDAHHQTDLILQVNAYLNRKFSFLNNVNHSQL